MCLQLDGAHGSGKAACFPIGCAFVPHIQIAHHISISASGGIQTRMIDIAKEMIAGTEKTVSQIAYELGFQYSQHFNRIFKKNTGYTPGEYRKLQI